MMEVKTRPGSVPLELVIFSCPRGQEEWILGIVRDAFTSGLMTGFWNAIATIVNLPEGTDQETEVNRMGERFESSVEWVVIDKQRLGDTGFPEFAAAIVSPARNMDVLQPVVDA